MPATLLITGGCGFIGSALIRYLLLHTDYTVVNLDKLTYAGNPASLADLAGHPRYCFEHADIADRAAVERILRRHLPCALMHLAAESHVDRSLSAPADFIASNIVGTYTLLEAVRACLPELPEHFRFHHISTDEVYGDLAAEQAPSTENAAYAPSSPYSASKAAADHLVHAWGRSYGIPVIISHCSNNYGPRQFPEKLIPATILRALHGMPLNIYGNGLQVRDWLHVDDHVRALLAVLTRGNTGERYHIGADNPRSNLETVTAVCAHLETLAPDKPQGVRRYADLLRHIADRPGHDCRYAVDSSKIRTQLGWQPQHSFESGLYDTVRWYLEHRDWWTPLWQRNSRTDAPDKL